MKITTEKKINADSLRSLCIKKNYYTRGTCDEYSALLKKCYTLDNVTDNDILVIALNIIKHSSDVEFEKEDIQSVMFEVNEISHTFYTIEE